MKQYCRLCAFICATEKCDSKGKDVWWCDEHHKYMSDSTIRSANKCDEYAYCGFDENGIEHKPKEYKRKVKVDNIALFDV